MPSNTQLNLGAAGDIIVTKQVSHDGDTAKLQMVGLATIAGTEDAYTMTAVPMGGGVEATAVRVTIASDSTGVLSIDDNGGSITVDGAVTVSGTITEASGAAIAASLSVMDDWDETDRAKVNIIAGQAGISAGAGAVGAGVPRVTLASDDPAVVALQLIDNAISGSEMQVDVVGALPAGDAAIGRVKLTDGTDIADILDLANSNPLVVAIVDAAGDQITSFGGGTQYTEDAAAAANPVGNALIVIREDARAGSLTTADGDNVALRGNNLGELYVKHTDAIPVTDNGGTLTVDNSTLAVVGGGTEATAMRVTIASDSTGVLSIDDNSASLTVDAPVGTPVFVRLSDGASAITTLAVSLASVPSHAVTNAGTFATQVDGAALTSLQLIDNLVLLEDAAHASGDPGVMSLGVRQDSDASLAGTTGDYAPFQLDANGFLKVNIKAGAGSGGTASTDDAAFTVGAGSGTPIMGLADETTPDSVDEGDVGVVRMTLTRALHVNLRDASGNELSVGGGTQYDEDTAHVSGDKLTMAGAVRQDTAASLAGTDGDRTALIVDSTGRLHVNVGNTINVASHAVTNAGTFAVQATLDAETTKVIGTVNISAAQTIATVTAVTAITNALPAGTNNIGNVDVLSIIPGTGATNLGKAVDSVAGATDTGIVGLFIRDDALTTLTPVDGDYVPGRVDSTGALHVRITGGGVSGIVDDAAFTPGTTEGVVFMAHADESAADAVDEGDAGALRMTLNRALHTTMRCADGATAMDEANDSVRVTIVSGAGSGGTSMTDDAAFTPGTTTITPIGAMFDDTTPDSVNEGDGGVLRMSGNRNLYVTLRDAAGNERGLNIDASGFLGVTDGGGSLTVDGTVAATQSGTWNVATVTTVTTVSAVTDASVQGKAAHDAAVSGNPLLIGAYASATAPAAVSADGDAVRLWSDLSGRLQIGDGGGSLTVDGTVAVSGTVTVGSHAVTNAGTFAVQVDGSALTSLQLLDDVVFTDDAAFTPGTSKVAAVGFTADEGSTDSVDEGDIGAARMTLDRKQIVTEYAHTAGGWTPSYTVSAASTNATSLKASAGQVGYVIATNVNAAIRYLKFYNKASSPTVGTDTPVLVLPIPGNTAGAGIAINFGAGVEFTTGIAWAMTTEATTAGTTGVSASEHVISIGYK